MVSKSPFFSVIIPTYNRFQKTVSAIASVKAQTFKDFEITIVDDNSTDDSLARLQNLYANDSSINLVKNEFEKGAAGARNFGTNLAKGLWVAFLDSDDVWRPEKLEIIFNAIESNKDGKIFYSDYEIIDVYKGTKVEVKQKRIQSKDLLVRNSIGGFSIPVFEKETLISVKGLDPHFKARQDIDLYLRLTPTHKFVHVPGVLVSIHSSNSDRISLNYNSKLSGALLFLEKHKSLLRQSATALFINYCNIFKFSIKSGNFKVAIRYVLRFIIAFLVVPRYAFSVLKNLVKHTIRKK